MDWFYSHPAVELCFARQDGAAPKSLLYQPGCPVLLGAGTPPSCSRSCLTILIQSGEPDGLVQDSMC